MLDEVMGSTAAEAEGTLEPSSTILGSVSASGMVPHAYVNLSDTNVRNGEVGVAGNA
jgi:hypothetical protein